MAKTISEYNNPIISHWELDEEGNKISIAVYKEPHIITESKIVLDGLPDMHHRVYIKNMEEIDILDEITKTNQYKVDYSHTGNVYFHPELEGQNITVDRYYSRGVVYYPAKRVWTKVDEWGNVTQTLDTISEQVEYIYKNIHHLDTAISQGESLHSKLLDDIDLATEHQVELQKWNTITNEQIEELIRHSELAQHEITNLEVEVSNAKNTQADLQKVILQGELKNSKLQNSISQANKNNKELSNNIDSSISANLKLQKAIDTANSTNLQLESNIAYTDKQIDILQGDISRGEQVAKDIWEGIEHGEFESLRTELNKIEQNKADKTYVDTQIAQAGKVKSVNGMIGDVKITAEDIPMSKWTSNSVSNSINTINQQMGTKANRSDLEDINKDISNLQTITSSHSGNINNLNNSKANKTHSHSVNDITETSSKQFISASEKSSISQKANKSDLNSLKDTVSKNYTTTQSHSNDISQLQSNVSALERDKLNRTALKDYAGYSTMFGVYRVDTAHKLQLNASTDASVDGEHAQLNATNDCTITESKLAQINASSNSLVEADRGQINASSGCECLGNWSQINSSYRSATHGQVSSVNSSWDSITDASTSMIGACRDTVVTKFGSSALSCRNAILNTSDSVVLASNNVEIPHYRGYVVTGGANPNASSESTQNRTWQIESLSGQIRAKGSVVGNSSFADFAEYMESSNGKQIPIGTIVSLDDKQKIKIAVPGDNPIGIISATAGIILNAQGFEWKDRYLYDRYGQPILIEQEVEDIEKIEELFNKQLEEDNPITSLNSFREQLDVIPTITMELPMLNPKYDPEREYIPREEREEWNVVGMKGQIYVNIDKTVKEHGYITIGDKGLATDGIIEIDYNGVKAHKLWQVMEITTPYTDELGYGIARVII